MTIHTPNESPSRVDKKYVVFKNVYCVFWPKKALKYVYFKRRFEKSGFGHQTS
jgi:hypothetical protein